MMKEKLQYLQKSVICLVFTLIFALSSLRPAFALQAYPVTTSMQSTHLYFIQFSDPFIELDKYKIGTGFSGVYNLSKKKLGIRPSVNHEPICLEGDKDGTRTAVKRTGGHLEIENALIMDEFFPKDKVSEYEAFKKENVGFFFELKDKPKGKPEDKGTLKIQWRSGMINERNSKDGQNPGDACAPDNSRQFIKKAIEEKTGYKYVFEDLGCVPGPQPSSDFCKKNVNFKGASLEGSNFEKADLKKANFKSADLEGANLEGANLKGAKGLPDIHSVDRKVLKVNQRIKVSGDVFGLSVTTTGDCSIYPSGTEALER